MNESFLRKLGAVLRLIFQDFETLLAHRIDVRTVRTSRCA